ncbi:MAG TPA: hypothetical protein VNY73_08365 [Bacteroidia bacterium]|nr:hypothetical protein [Bacteroidia bacterium]
MKKNFKRNYQCKSCKEVIQSAIFPYVLKCHVAGVHSWHDMGYAGNTTYTCTKCHTKIQSEKMPMLYPCPAGESHHWID